MPQTQSNQSVIGATKIAVGLTQVVRIMPTEFDFAQTLKIFSGGGTLEIISPVLSGSSTPPGGSYLGTGYPLGASEIYKVEGPAVIYLAATGATMVLAMTLGKTSGATVL